MRTIISILFLFCSLFLFAQASGGQITRNKKVLVKVKSKKRIYKDSQGTMTLVKGSPLKYISILIRVDEREDAEYLYTRLKSCGYDPRIVYDNRKYSDESIWRWNVVAFSCSQEEDYLPTFRFLKSKYGEYNVWIY